MQQQKIWAILHLNQFQENSLTAYVMLANLKQKQLWQGLCIFSASS